MENDVKITLNAIKEDIHELKDLNKTVVELIQETSVIREELKSSNAKHDKGREVLHKQQDAIIKVLFWVGSTVFVAMGVIIMTLLEKILT
jgi:chromosome segregation ATPase